MERIKQKDELRTAPRDGRHTAKPLGDMGADKELRSTNSATEILFMLLMVASQAAAWVMVITLHASPPLRLGLGGLAVFHALWALRNFVSVNRRERGMISYGVLACGCFFALMRVTLLGAGMVWLSYLFVATSMGVATLPASKLAHLRKQTLVWAYVFKLYVFSNLALWPVVAVLVVRRYGVRRHGW